MILISSKSTEYGLRISETEQNVKFSRNNLRRPISYLIGPYLYCNVLEGSIQMELYCNSKTQQTTVKYSRQLSEHTCASNLFDLRAQTHPIIDCLSLHLTLDSNRIR
jgi:hypothetical protein